jgi:EAL domain-containing protein (putative c-di-GMP-specific phosphodiesterase class I)/GGDEF domain-containing protein
VNIHTGVCYGCEALLRNYEAAGFKSPSAFFDQAYRDKMLYQVDLVLREKAVEKFSRLKWNYQAKLFFNLDCRVLDSENYQPGNTLNILKKYHFPKDAVCFELSEQHKSCDTELSLFILNTYRSQGFKVAVDDYGIGFSDLQLIYYTKPDFIKIDRFFIREIEKDPDKKVFVSSIVNMAHLMGSVVVAEGVETKEEYYGCRRVGCDLIQGYLIQHPETDIDRLKSEYSHIRELNRIDQRYKNEDRKLIDTEMAYIEPLSHDCDVLEAFKKFRKENSSSFFPVINQNGEPLGIISEKSFKEYIYSRYGDELLLNPAFGKSLSKFITKYPVADIHTPVEKILEIYSHNENIEGILIAEGMKYKGFLSANSLLKVLNEKNIAIARDQNPLSKLPGNTLIHAYVSEALQDTANQYIFVYFDFDNFKPYNDTYGFRQGDRVILLFAEMLKSRIQCAKRFAGHIGGDDFFMGFSGVSAGTVYSEVAKMGEQFRTDAESFYDVEAIEKGYIMSKDREGNCRTFPLITVSAVILELPAMRSRICSADEIGNILAEQKKNAKKCPEKICIVRIAERIDFEEDKIVFKTEVRALPEECRQE